MKLVKMLRTIELPGGNMIGDISYECDDAKADGLIAAGDAELIKVISAEPAAAQVPSRRATKAADDKKTGKRKKNKKK